MEKPANPVLFYKPATSLGGPVDNIPVHAVAQDDDCLDYESELVVTMGSKCTDVTEDEALDYVLGYSVGNDVSHRKWQLQGGGGQWSLGKGFDGWAPFGPGIVTGKAIDNAQALKIWTKVNGETRQVSAGSSSGLLGRITASLRLGLTMSSQLEWDNIQHAVQHPYDYLFPQSRGYADAWRCHLYRDVSGDEVFQMSVDMGCS